MTAAASAQALPGCKFPGNVSTDWMDGARILGFGRRNSKLGHRVQRGQFAGYVIRTLTLVEMDARGGCPPTCPFWQAGTCYGRHMRWARRCDPSPDPIGFADAVTTEAVDAAERDRHGVLVRLHVLGDFYSREYTCAWRNALLRSDRLAVYGYTHHAPGSAIGRAIDQGRKRWGARFAVRFSGAPDVEGAALTEHEAGDAFTCPEQTGRLADCASCALCWDAFGGWEHGRRRAKAVRFLTH